MASRALTVKVATPKVIKALEAKLIQVKKDKENEGANEAKFQKTLEKWNKEIAKFAIERIKDATDIRASYRSWNNSLNVDFNLKVTEGEFPAQPVRDFTTVTDYSFNEMVEEIENAIRILKMTDEETVNASTFKSIAKYL